MSSNQSLFKRKSLNEICSIPKEFISVYIVEKHIWADDGSEEARKKRNAELKTVQDFLIDPVRSLLNDVFRQISAPYDPTQHDKRVGQGYWVQAEFGSGKSHLLSFIGALALGDEKIWNALQQKEKEAGVGKRDSLYYFWEKNNKKKNEKDSKGVFVVVKTLVGQGSGTIGIDDSDSHFVEYILDAIQEQYMVENGQAISLYPVEILAERFLEKDLDLYRGKLEKFLSDPRFFDDPETLETFIKRLQDETDPGLRRDCGNILWRFYKECLETKPLIQMETEDILKHAVEVLLEEGYQGLLLILDEVSLFMQNRTGNQRVEDEKTLVVLSNRLVHNHNLPVWTVCSAQQKIVSRLGERNIIANERLKLVPLLNDEKSYYDIALSRVRKITDESAAKAYYEDYKKSFTWPDSIGQDEFSRFFPFYPPAIDVVKAISYNLTTVRSALYFMHQALKTTFKTSSKEMITLWNIFDDVVKYEEDPSGTTQGIASIKTQWDKEWKAYEAAKRQIDSVTRGEIKRYRSRCEKILKTLFLYSIAKLRPDGLNDEELMNAVMEWKDHDGGQQADKTDNLDHYEILNEKVDLELVQVKKKDKGYIFVPEYTGFDWNDIFNKARMEAEQSKLLQDQAWEFLLRLKSWEIKSSFGVVDLVQGKRSIFAEVASSSQQKLKIQWHKREIAGSVLMRDLLEIAKNRAVVPMLDSSSNDEDFAVYISSDPCEAQLHQLAVNQKDARILFWSPAAATATEQKLIIDLAAYIQIVNKYKNEGTQDARNILEHVQSRIKDQIGQLTKIVPDRYSRGMVCATDHTALSVKMQGTLSQILEPALTMVLDATYESKDIDIKPAAIFTDDEAVKVINGIICKGSIPKNAKLDKNISAVQNYAADLGIVKPGNEKKLDTSGSRYVRDLKDWITQKISDGSLIVPVDTVYKNFMGTGYPGNINYGLSRRLIDLYLLCLVREGKIRISADERFVQGGFLDYATIADIAFKKQTFGAMRGITLMKAPEGWSILAPFAAILLDDSSVGSLKHDADIQDAILRLIDVLNKLQPRANKLEKSLADLFVSIGVDNPMEEDLKAWQSFVETYIDKTNQVACILNGLDKAFDYKAYSGQKVRKEDTDDFKSRKVNIENSEKFAENERDIRAAVNYAKLTVSKDPLKTEIKSSLKRLRKSMGQLNKMIIDPAKLTVDLLEPLDKTRETYTVRFMQIFDKVIAAMETARSNIAAITEGEIKSTLEALNNVSALNRVDLSVLHNEAQNAMSGLLPEDLEAHTVRIDLRDTPYPRGCGDLIADAEGWIKTAKDVVDQTDNAYRGQVERHAKMLQSPKLSELLEQGKKDSFIAKFLATKDVSELTDLLISEMSAKPELAKILNKYLKKIRIKKVSLSDFDAGMETISPDDISQVVETFRKFLESQIVEIESGETIMLTIE